MSNEYMNEQDAPSAKKAEVFVTIGNKRYKALNAKNCEVNANLSSKEIAVLGKMIKGRKVTGMTIKGKMTVHKCTEIFDDIVTQYKNTGNLPTFDLQISNYDETTCMGRSTKIYNDCVIDGDVLLSMFDAEGEFIEQTIEFYASDYSRPEKYKNPAYM